MEYFYGCDNQKFYHYLKSHKISIVKFMICLMLCLGIVTTSGCGGTKVVGKWQLDRLTDGVKTIYYNTEIKGEYASDFDSYINILNNTNGVLNFKQYIGIEFSWQRGLDNIKLLFNSQELTFVLRGNELIYDIGSIRYFFKIRN